tara:strand:- start:217 stop:642 length:426 start_codon:yes stop_codon:yes gene_type:complete
MDFWYQVDKWKISGFNTLTCLLGCSIGDFGTILYFQIYTNITDIYIIMPIAIVIGILTSIFLETIILIRSMNFIDAIKTATGMSMISMISMELAMNFTDIMIEGALVLSVRSILPVLFIGFIVPWPYNYWRLVKYNKKCCN